MGHQWNNARKALRAYARDLHTAASRGGSVASIGTPKEDDAPTQFLGSGAPHQLAIAAAVVCVVLLGGIGFVNATSAPDPAGDELTNPPSAQTASAVSVFASIGDVSTSQAIRAFNDLGLREVRGIDRRAVVQRVESNSGSERVAWHRALQRVEDAYTFLEGDIT